MGAVESCLNRKKSRQKTGVKKGLRRKDRSIRREGNLLKNRSPSRPREGGGQVTIEPAGRDGVPPKE